MVILKMPLSTNMAGFHTDTNNIIADSTLISKVVMDNFSRINYSRLQKKVNVL